MAVLKLTEALASRVTQEVDPIVAALNVYLSSPRVADYFKNATIENHVVFFSATEKLVGAPVDISVSGKAGLKTAIETATWKDVKIVYNASTKTLEISFSEKVPTPPVVTPQQEDDGA